MSFDPLARHYTWMEWLIAGRQLQRCRTALIEEVRSARSILLVGEGHGRFLPELCRANAEASITCVDASATMLRVARRRLVREGIDRRRVDFQVRSIHEVQAPAGFDLVVTQFFLDCFPPRELEQVVHKIAASLRAGGKWIVSDFQIADGGWRKIRSRLVLAVAYTFFRAVVKLQASQLIDPAPYLAASGLIPVRSVSLNFGLLYSQLWEKSRCAALDN